MSDTPLTDEVSREIGRIAFPLRTRDISLPEFVDLAQAQLDKFKNLERELAATTEERDELREEVKSLKETILDQENHIMELQARRPFTPGYTAEP